MIELDAPKLDVLKGGFHIPSKPEILTELVEEMNREDASIDVATSILTRDIELSALLLRTVNSPLFGFSRKISDMKQAARLLGLEQLYRLVTVALLKQTYSKKACITMERFWDESLDIAKACVWIGGKCKSVVPIADLYALGLFHNIGIAAMATRYQDYADLLQLANQNGNTSMTGLEQHRYQCDHATVGYYIAISWQLPKDICQVILNHHSWDYLRYCHSARCRAAYAILKCAEHTVMHKRREQNHSDWRRVGEACTRELQMNETSMTALFVEYTEHILTH